MKTYLVSREIKVEVDESKFTPEFLAEFRANFYDFEMVEEHRRHLAELVGLDLIHHDKQEVEGYGCLADFGFKFSKGELEMEEALD